MGASEKLAAAFHPTTATTSEHACRDCGAKWTSQSAADECELLDSIESKQARRTKG